MKGFGSIAIGTRISHIKDDFFISWSRMLVAGIRKNDELLTPQKGLAAHKAANNLAREFLEQSKKDTLLLVDDDMSFEHDALERLRSKKENWKYDIVSGLSYTKGDSSKPIVLKLIREQPQYPQSRVGEIYGFYTGYKEGETEPVATTGMAFTLIRRKVLEKMVELEGTPPEYVYFFEYEKGLESEDISFCRKARNEKFRIGVDTGVKIGHIGDKIFS